MRSYLIDAFGIEFRSARARNTKPVAAKASTEKGMGQEIRFRPTLLKT